MPKCFLVLDHASFSNLPNIKPDLKVLEEMANKHVAYQDARPEKDDGSLSAMPVFSEEMGRAFQDDLDLLRVLKQLKYFWNLPKSHLAILLEQLSRRICSDE